MMAFAEAFCNFVCKNKQDHLRSRLIFIVELVLCQVWINGRIIGLEIGGTLVCKQRSANGLKMDAPDSRRVSRNSAGSKRRKNCYVAY